MVRSEEGDHGSIWEETEVAVVDYFVGDVYPGVVGETWPEVPAYCDVDAVEPDAGGFDVQATKTDSVGLDKVEDSLGVWNLRWFITEHDEIPETPKVPRLRIGRTRCLKEFLLPPYCGIQSKGTSFSTNRGKPLDCSVV